MNPEPSLDVLVEFFREFIIRNWGKGEGFEDITTASPEKVLSDYISPQWNRELAPAFIETKILDGADFKKYSLPVVKGEVDPQDSTSLKLYEDSCIFFNPSVVFADFNPYQSEKLNLSVLTRDMLSEKQLAELVGRGEKWLDLFYKIEKEREFFWSWRFSIRVESLLAKAEPYRTRDFVQAGKVIGFNDIDNPEFPSVGSSGAVVGGFEKHHCANGVGLISLINTDKNKFGHLLNKEVRYHYRGIVRDYAPLPYGELIAV